jgi:hypothetical protein
MSAAPALVSSAGHVQYVTIGLSLGSRSTDPSMFANAAWTAPGMCPSSYDRASRTSTASTSPRFNFARRSSAEIRGTDASSPPRSGSVATGGWAAGGVVNGSVEVGATTGASAEGTGSKAVVASGSTVRVNAQISSAATTTAPAARSTSVVLEETVFSGCFFFAMRPRSYCNSAADAYPRRNYGRGRIATQLRRASG